MGERTIHIAYYKTADEQNPNLSNLEVEPTPQPTVNGSTSFNFSGLAAATDYTVKASMSLEFPTHQTEGKYSQPYLACLRE